MNHPPTVTYIGTRLPHAVFNLLVVDPFAWGVDWAWALPLIVLTVVIHTIGLGLVSQAAVRASGRIAAVTSSPC